MRPEHTFLLRIFDYMAAILYGAAASTLAGYLTQLTGWPFPAGMALGMVLGMASAFPILVILSIVCGGFEVIMMSMLISMTAGMGAGMAGDASLYWFIGFGSVVGVSIQFMLHMLDLKLHGDLTAEGVIENE